MDNDIDIDLNRYVDFVGGVTSSQSNNPAHFISELESLDFKHRTGDAKVTISLLVTAAMGLAGESGEFSELVKKLLFQGKELNAEVKDHMIKELGDVIFYWIEGCRALNINPNEVIERNVKKLSSRYPGGSFDVHKSENREHGDV